MLKPLTYLLILLPPCLLSQNYKKDITEVSRNLMGLNNYALTMQYKLFLDDNLNKPYQERVVKVKRSGYNLWLQQSSGMETLDNERYQIIANSQNKTLTILKKEKPDPKLEQAKRKEFNNFFDGKIDSLLMIYKTIKVIKNTKEQITYEMTFKPNDLVEKTLLTINKVQNMYGSLTIKYKQPMPLEDLDGSSHRFTLQINYLDFKAGQLTDATIFNENNYITPDKKGGLQPSKKYSGFQLNIPDEL